MDPIGTAALTLGTQVVKSACKLWIGDGAADDMAETVADLLKDRVSDAIQRHRLKVMFENFAGTVADKAARAKDPRVGKLPENEREAAIRAVAETFEMARLTDSVMFAADLDARVLERHLRGYVGTRTSAWGLSDRATGYFNFLLRECCSYLLEVKKTLGSFTSQALTELLRRTASIEGQLAQVLERMPTRTSMSGDEGFETDYRRQIASELDYINLFGASVFERNRGYALSIAYISLLVADSTAPVAQQVQGVAVESVLAESRRLLFRGEAGSGKTTLLQWIAVSAARREFPEQMAAWNSLVPFFIRLRRFADGRALPSPQDFLTAGAAATLDAEMPPGWVNRVLRDGRGIVLVDGVDEVPRTQRMLIVEWLHQLIAAFPLARFVVTSRPAAADEDWLALQEFRACFVQPMTLSDVQNFIVHWHEAIARTVVESAAKHELGTLAGSLAEEVANKQHLRQLATNPLMCALLCALNRDRHAALPQDRIELFRISLEMFLQRRDTERQMQPNPVQMEYPDALRLLQELAYWMMRNDLATAEQHRVLGLITERLGTMRHHIVGAPEEVLEYALERSGVIREPVSGWVDFIHRSFQEYLAAQAAIDRDDIEALIARAADDQWRQVVILAVGLGNRRQSEQIFHGLLHPPRRLRRDKAMLELTALGCLETAKEVDAAIAERIRVGTESLIPPRSPEHVAILSRAGEYAFELLADVEIDDVHSMLFATQLAGKLGGDFGIRFLERIGADPRPQFDGEMFTELLVGLWPSFDSALFAERLLARRKVTGVSTRLPAMIPGLTMVPSISTLSCDFGPEQTDYTFLKDMPGLRQVQIVLPGSPAPLSIAVSSGLELLSLERPDAPPHFHGGGGPTLRFNGLDTARALAEAELLGGFERLVIVDDGRLCEHDTLVVPPDVEEIEFVRSSPPPLMTDWAVSRVRRFVIDDPVLPMSWSTWIAVLTSAGEYPEQALLTRLESLKLRYHDGDQFGLAAGSVEWLGKLGFEINVQKLGKGGSITATRPGAVGP